jgi:serine/threonine protein kinase
MCQSARVRKLLDESWGPSSSNDVTESFIIISPLSSTTLQFVCQSNILVVNQRDRTILFSHLLDAIAFLHGLGISHRDIKPPNVLVHSLKPPHAVLTDFGCASDQDIMEYATVGTIPYLAPEQVEGKTHTSAVDLWAAALVGAQMMRAPLHSKRLVPGDLFNIYRRSLKFSNNVMATCCRSMLDVVPENRMSAAAAYALLAEYLQVKEPRGNPENGPDAKRKRLDGAIPTQSVVSEIGQTTELLGLSS